MSPVPTTHNKPNDPSMTSALSAPPVRLSNSLFSDPDFLTCMADAYFPGRAWQTQVVRVQGQAFRLLSVDGLGLQTQLPFLDYHLPLAQMPAHGVRPLSHLDGVAGQALPLSQAAPLSLGAPVLHWDEFGDWDAYRNLLRERRILAEDERRWRRLEGVAGPLRFTLHDDRPDVMPTVMAWKNARDREAQRPALFDQPGPARFLKAWADAGRLRVSTLRGTGQLLAIWLGCVHQGVWGGWVFCFNPKPELSRCSPGRQLLYPMLRSSLEEGHSAFDFSVGLEPYKLGFATHVKPMARLGRAPLWGRVWHAVAKRWPASTPDSANTRPAQGSAPGSAFGGGSEGTPSPA